MDQLRLYKSAILLLIIVGICVTAGSYIIKEKIRMKYVPPLNISKYRDIKPTELVILKRKQIDIDKSLIVIEQAQREQPVPSQNLVEQKEVTDITLPALNVRIILLSDLGNLALIGDQFVKEGDLFQGFTVKKITSNEICFEFKGHEKCLKLKNGGV